MKKHAVWCVRALLSVALLAAVVGARAAAENGAMGEPIVFTAEQSTGGKVVDLPDQTRGVTLDASCELPWPQVTRIDWRSAEPMPAGWWHGTVTLGKRAKEDLGWVQDCFGIALLSPEKPLVSLMDNFRLPPLPPGVNQYSAPGPFQFEFWIYSAFPATGVSVRPVYSQAWKYKRQWPVTQVTMQHVPAPWLAVESPVVLDLQVRPDGTAELPDGLPVGMWGIAFHSKAEGEAAFETADGHTIRTPFKTSFASEIWSGGACIWLDSAMRGIALKGAPRPNAFTLHNCLIRTPAEPLPTAYKLMQTTDPAQTESARLELVGANLPDTPPSLPLLPMGRKTAVTTSWDDGPEVDLRLAEILKRLGMRGTFFLNANNPGMAALDKLEALGCEIGSHCYTHCFLFQLPPKQAAHECAAMRELLEEKLKHPVISFSYPNGYSRAYDTEGDYVLRAVRAAGYWLGRTTAVSSNAIDSVSEPAALATDGFFGEDQRGLIRQWDLARAKEGALFHVWGHAWQLGKTDEQWKKVEENLTRFAGQPDAWYATQGEVAVWRWLRANVQITVAARSEKGLTVTVTRPWLHPYLAAECPLSLKLPEGVQKAIWQGKEIPVVNGFVELPWP